MLFGVVFPPKSFVLTSDQFQQVDTNRWVLDLSGFVGERYREELNSVCVFLANEAVLPADGSKAMSVYVKSPGSGWEYRGAVANERPSGIFTLRWPPASIPFSPADTAQIGISIESVEDVKVMENNADEQQASFAKNIALDLFRYLESFMDNSLSSGLLDKWFQRFQEKYRRDPNFLSVSRD